MTDKSIFDRCYYLYDSESYNEPDYFAEVQRDIAERYVDFDYPNANHLDYESAVKHEMDVMDHETVWEEINCLLEEDIEIAYDEINAGLKGDYILATGQLGLWDGGRSVADYFEDVQSAMLKMVGHDCELRSIMVYDGRVTVRVVHHDGANAFELRAIPERTVDAFEEWRDGTGPFGYLDFATMLHRVERNPYWSRPLIAD